MSELIKSVRKSNIHAWERLKYETLEFGFLSHYPIQNEFLPIARSALAQLPYEKKTQLKACLYSRKPELKLRDHESEVEYYSNELVEHFASLVVEEIVCRARVAAYREL